MNYENCIYHEEFENVLEIANEVYNILKKLKENTRKELLVEIDTNNLTLSIFTEKETNENKI